MAELTARDLFDRSGRGIQRSGDAAGEQPADQAAGNDREARRNGLKPHLVRDALPRRLPCRESVARRDIRETVDLTLDGVGLPIEGGHLIRRCRDGIQGAAQAVPRSHRRLNRLGRLHRAVGPGALGHDGEILRQGRCESGDLGITLRRLRTVAGSKTSDESRAHPGEVGRRRPSEAGRHERFVIRARDERTDMRDRHGR
ncbi:hypothetical protein [Methylobacterium sp. UNC378MF]|uniref:hypothetical protein n=1 Tax=Methylobacterium sp. UNC378MF TaxID=1502748 RepID=UPI001FCDCBEF|nr:hypothetical protein [Methylobacterium sp. UNC378MF]